MQLTKRRKDTFTFEQHREIAKHVLVILQAVSDLREVLESTNAQSRATDSKTHEIGRAAWQAQAYFERLLSRDDSPAGLGDLRSWDLYFPKGKPAARTIYVR